MSKMPRSRVVDTTAQQRQPRRSVPKPTAGSQPDVRLRPTKLENAGSSRAPLHEKQHGARVGRVAELEAKLGEALEELRKLREQLAVAESYKQEFQRELEEAKKRIPPSVTDTEQPPDEEREEEVKKRVPPSVPDTEQPPEEEKEEEHPAATQKSSSATEENSEVTDVFEVVPVPLQTDRVEGNIHDCNKAMEEARKLSEKEMGRLMGENEMLKKELAGVVEKEAVTDMKIAALEAELRVSNESMERMGEQLEAMEEVKVALQEEMKRVCLRSDQWKKAAEEALALLYNRGEKGLEMEGMFMGLEEELGGGKWKAMFGRKKSQHK